MKIYLVLLTAFLSIVSYSQERSIVVHKKNSEKTKEIAENKRIRVVTLDGKKYYGRFTIVDSASIKINGNVVALNSITKMKRRSLFSSILKPVLIALSTVSIIGGVAGLASGGYGGVAAVVLLPPAVIMVSVAAISSSYNRKNWEYSIRYNNENYPIPSPVIVKETGTEP